MPRGIYDRSKAKRRTGSDKPQAADKAPRKSTRAPAAARQRPTGPAAAPDSPVVAVRTLQQRYGDAVSMGVAEPLHTWLCVTAKVRGCSPEQLLQECITDYIGNTVTKLGDD